MTSRVDVALPVPQRAPKRLERNGLDAPLSHAEGEVVQAWQRRRRVAAGTAPENFRGARGSRPHNRVQIFGAGLFGPQQLLACEKQSQHLLKHNAGCGGLPPSTRCACDAEMLAWGSNVYD